MAKLLEEMHQGLMVCGQRFDFFAVKTDHKMVDIKVYYVATMGDDDDALKTVAKVNGQRRTWRTAADARKLFAEFDQLPSVEKLLKRTELCFSSTTRVLRGRR